MKWRCSLGMNLPGIVGIIGATACADKWDARPFAARAAPEVCSILDRYCRAAPKGFPFLPLSQQFVPFLHIPQKFFPISSYFYRICPIFSTSSKIFPISPLFLKNLSHFSTLSPFLSYSRKCAYGDFSCPANHLLISSCLVLNFSLRENPLFSGSGYFQD